MRSVASTLRCSRSDRPRWTRAEGGARPRILLLAAALLALASAPRLAAAESPKSGARRLKNELTVVPVVGGDTDAGFGGGYMASLARVGGDYEPYLWRVQSASALLVKGSDKIDVSYIDSYLLLDLPHIIKNRLRLQFRISYTRETQLNYFGIGNASVEPNGATSDARYRYGRVHPTVQVKFDDRLGSSVHLLWGISYTRNSLLVARDSRLSEDYDRGSSTLQRLIGGLEPHDVALFSYGIAWDDRDDEVNPRRGQFHSARIDMAPGGGGRFPHRWARVNVAFKFYVPLVPRRLTFAARAVGDLLIGGAPVYELPRYDDTSAIGGANGVRGIPAQRYYGRAKLFGNLELRSELVRFHMFRKDNVFGVTAFLDGGRVFSELPAHPELDGEGLGLKVGGGVGLRLAAGKSFVLRFDTAWSDRYTPSSVYLAAGQVF